MGQNFLQDDNLARWMAEALGAGPDDVIVEIGPGTGAVTRHLVGRAKRLILVEKDEKLAEHQREAHAEDPSVEVIVADATEIDLRPFFKLGPLRVIGNLPYSLGTTILARWLENPSPVGAALFMLQKEVCERITAPPRCGDYGQLTVRLQARWHAKLLKVVPNTVFVPRPAVESAIISLTPRPRVELPVFNEILLEKLVRQGFLQRRKQLKNNLGDTAVPWTELTGALGVPETVRAEELSVEQWVELTRRLDPHPLADHAQSGEEVFDVVDDQDAVTGQATRAEVHRQGLKHRAVHVFAFNKRGELILQKRSHLKDTCPEKWDSSAAGHLDAGEAYAACAERELQEELGATRILTPPVRVARLAACVETGWEFVELHAARVDGRFQFPAAEIECVEAFPLAEVRAWAAARPEDFAPGFLRCLSEFPDTAVPPLPPRG